MTQTTYTTQIGFSELSFLNEPSYKFDPDGKFSTKLRLTHENAQIEIDRIEKAFNEKYAEIEEELNKNVKGSQPRKIPKVADKPYEVVYDEEGNDTGFTKFNFGQKHKVRTKAGKVLKFTPKIYNAKGVQVHPAVYNGSEIKVAYTIYPWYTAALGVGVSLRLVGTKVYNLVTGSGGDVSEFQKAEEGWDGEDDASDNDEELDESEDFAGDDDDPEI